MLEGDFFKIHSRRGPDADPAIPGTRILSVIVELNPGHRIYEGHFPGNPVVPGVCQIQMVREVLESSLGVKGMLSSGDQIKFLHPIVPRENPVLEIHYKIKDIADGMDFSASITQKETVFLKLRGSLCTKPW